MIDDVLRHLDMEEKPVNEKAIFETCVEAAKSIERKTGYDLAQLIVVFYSDGSGLAAQKDHVGGDPEAVFHFNGPDELRQGLQGIIEIN